MLRRSSDLLRGCKDMLDVTSKTPAHRRPVRNSCCQTPDWPQGTCKGGRRLMERSRCRVLAILHEATVSLEKTKYLASSSNWLSSQSSRVGKSSGRSCSLKRAVKQSEGRSGQRNALSSRVEVKGMCLTNLLIDLQEKIWFVGGVDWTRAIKLEYAILEILALGMDASPLP